MWLEARPPRRVETHAILESLGNPLSRTQADCDGGVFPRRWLLQSGGSTGGIEGGGGEAGRLRLQLRALLSSLRFWLWWSFSSVSECWLLTLAF